jgi:hypothetical protein
LYLYVFALLGFLSAGIISFDVIGIALLLYRLIKQPQVSMGCKNYYQLVWLLPFIVFLRAIPRDYRFTMSDEFSSLGANIKELFRKDALGGIRNVRSISIAARILFGFIKFLEMTNMNLKVRSDSIKSIFVTREVVKTIWEELHDKKSF